MDLRAGPPRAARARRLRLAEHLAAAERRAVEVDRASVELVLPVLDGGSPVPAPVLPPTTGKDTHAPEPTTSSPRRSGGSRTTSSATSLAASPDRVELRGAVRGAGRGALRRHDRRLEGRPCACVGPWPHRLPVTWPEADVRTEATLDLRSDAEAYHVVITLVAEELGPSPARRLLPRAAVGAVVSAAACVPAAPATLGRGLSLSAPSRRPPARCTPPDAPAQPPQCPAAPGRSPCTGRRRPDSADGTDTPTARGRDSASRP